MITLENKRQAVDLIKRKLNNETFLSYKEIAELTGYHPKYILKLRNDVKKGNISFIHGNKNKIPVNSMSEEEKQKIINLYKKSNVSIRKFCNFYHTRSYSCIYNLLKENGLLNKE